MSANIFPGRIRHDKTNNNYCVTVPRRLIRDLEIVGGEIWMFELKRGIFRIRAKK